MWGQSGSVVIESTCIIVVSQVRKKKRESGIGVMSRLMGIMGWCEVVKGGVMISG